MAMIDTAVEALDHLDTVAPAIGALGARHAGYGVQPADYDKVAAAPLWTLRKGLGETFTTEVESAWTEVYGHLTAVMLAGAAAGDGATA